MNKILQTEQESAKEALSENKLDGKTSIIQRATIKCVTAEQ